MVLLPLARTFAGPDGQRVLEELGQAVKAVVVHAPGASVDAEQLAEWTRETLAAYKVPKQLFIVEQVMRAPNGKADYQWARKEVETRLG